MPDTKLRSRLLGVLFAFTVEEEAGAACLAILFGEFFLGLLSCGSVWIGWAGTEIEEDEACLPFFRGAVCSSELVGLADAFVSPFFFFKEAGFDCSKVGNGADGSEDEEAEEVELVVLDGSLEK